MARSPLLGGSTLSPFGGGGGGFGAFAIVNPGREAYLTFLKTKVRWDDGDVSNAEYLTAYEKYVNSQKAGSSTRLEAEQSLRDTRYRLERNDLLAEVEDGTKTWDDLLTYDRSKLEGLNRDSQEYLTRQDLYRQTQQRAYSDAVEEQQDLYSDGKLTTSQLRSWFLDQRNHPDYGENPELLENIDDQVTALNDRLTSEVDDQVMGDFGDGKMTTDAFLTYATAARARYAAGTKQAQEWDEAITDAKDQVLERSLTYRYGLSQDYVQLQKFIKDNEDMLAKAGAGGTSTSTRIVLGADGQWKTVESTKTSPYAPSASELEAMRQRRIELADAKAQLAEVTNKIGGAGGFMPTEAMISFYSGKQSSYAVGTDEWYAVQERLDSLEQQRHAESVLSQEGVRVTFGGAATSSGAAPASAGGGGAATPPPSAGAPKTSTGGKAVTLDGFLAAIGSTESGGNYDSVNKQTGARGKYQIMPSNWSAWAAKYLGNANAPMSPENQEKVVRGKMQDLYTWLGSWDKVAHWWLTGDSSDPGKWSASSTAYVNKVMGQLGQPPVGVRAGTVLAAGVVASAKGPLEVVTSSTRNEEAVVESRGKVLPKGSLQTTRASFQAGLDGSAFTKFYSGFVAAFKNGATTFTDWSSGSPVTYSLPEDLGARADMMNSLDDLRIGYYATRAEAYAGTPSEITASDQYSDAIKDKADNAYTILVTVQKGGPGKGPVYDPIAAGQAVVDQAKKYAANQYKLAKAAYDRGDLTGAYSHYQLAEKTLTEAQAKVEIFIKGATSAMGAIENAYGEAAPESVAAAFEKMTDFKTTWGDEIKNLTSLGTDVKKWARLDPKGNPVWGVDETISLHDGAAIFLSPDGKLKYDQVPSGGFKPDGGQLTAIPGYVPVKVNVGGTSPQGTVYAKWETGPVGYTAAGEAIQGKVVSVFLNGKYVTAVEDPFHPGKWSMGKLDIKAPPGFKLVPGATEGSFVYQFSSGGGKGGQAGTYRLSWNPTTGSYDFIKAGDTFTPDQIYPIGDPDTAALIKGLGLGVDLSKVPSTDRWMYDQTGASLGFSKPEYIRFTTPPTPTKMPQKVVDIRGGQLGTPMIDSEQERIVAGRRPVAPLPATTSTGPVRDQWASDQQDKTAALPPPAIKPLPPLATPMIESPEETRVAYRTPPPVAAPPPAAPAPTQLTSPMVESTQELAVVNRTPVKPPVKPPVKKPLPKPLPKIANKAL